MKKSTYVLIVFVPTLAVLLYLLSRVFTPLIVSCLESSIIDIENRIQVFTETNEALFVGYLAVPYFYYCNMARVLHLNNGILAIILESILLAINVILLVLAFYTGENQNMMQIILNTAAVKLIFGIISYSECKRDILI